MSMKGQPAFENIDEVLAEKIISHTNISTDKNNASTFEKSDCKNESCCAKTRKKGFDYKKILFFLLFSGILLFFFTPHKKKGNK